MNEDRHFEEVFDPIRTHISASDPVRNGVRRRRRAPRRMLAVGAFMTAGAIVAALALIPRTSVASTMRRIQVAIGSHAIHVQTFGEDKAGKRVLVSEIFTAGGQWRSDGFPGRDIARTWIKAGDRQYLYLACNNVAVGEPLMDRPLDRVSTVVDFAKLISDFGFIDQPREFSIERRPNEKGKPVYAIVGLRKATQYRLELIVDKATDLPIRATIEQGDAEGNPVAKTFELFTYDDFDPKTEFDPHIRPDTTVMDLIKETDRLKKAWATPIMSLITKDEQINLRSISVNRRGEVFMAISVSPHVLLKNAPVDWSRLVSTFRDQDGRRYELVDSFMPGGTFGDTNARGLMRFGTDDVRLEQWAPLDGAAPQTPITEIQFDTPDGTKTIALPAPIPTRFPAYDAPLLLGQVDAMFDMRACETRARLCETEHDLHSAAYWYEQAAIHAFPSGWARRYYEDAAGALKRAGAKP